MSRKWKHSCGLDDAEAAADMPIVPAVSAAATSASTPAPVFVQTPSVVIATPEAIIRAGKLRRGELAVPIPKPRTEIEKMAARIVAAAAKARGKLAPELPTHPTARALTLLNWRRNGGLNADNAAWSRVFFTNQQGTRDLLRSA
jgi:hypothetical protein